MPYYEDYLHTPPLTEKNAEFPSLSYGEEALPNILSYSLALL